MRKNKFLAALAIAACLATAVPFSASAATVKTDIYKSVTKATDRAALEKIFNAKAYAEKNPDLKAAGITTDAALFNHFLTFGLWEGRECSDTFSVSAYKSGNPDLQKAFVDDILAYYLHYEAFGKTEKRTLVTVEACAKAGITVKNAATGAVISNGAAPAASTASSSTTTSTSEEKKEEEKKTEEETKESETGEVKNTVGIEQVATAPRRADEALFNNDIDYDYATGKFYSLADAKTATKTNANQEAGIVQVGSGYFQTVALGSSGTLKPGMAMINATTFYNSRKALVGADQTKAVSYGLNPDDFEYDAATKRYYLIAKNYEEYTVSGGDWNFKKDDNGDDLWEIYNGKSAWYNFEANLKKGSETVGVKATKTDYLREINDNGTTKYATTFHYASTAVADTTNTDKDEHSFQAVTALNDLDLRQAYYESVANGEVLFNVSAVSGYALKVTGTTVKAHKHTKSIAEACDVNEDDFILINGKYVWASPINIPADELKNYCYANKGYKMFGVDYMGTDTFVVGTVSVYKTVSRDDALADGYVYYGTLKYDKINGSDQYLYGNKFGDDLVYDSTADLGDGGKITTYPDAPKNAVWVGKDKKYYKVISDPEDIFAHYATKNFVQAKDNNRFYETNK